MDAFLLSIRLRFALVAIALAAALLPVRANAQTTAAIEDVQPNASLTLGPHRIRVTAPRDAVQRWKRARQQVSAPGSSVAFAFRDFREAHALLHAQFDDGVADLELAFLAAFYQRGLVSIDTANAWFDFLTQWPSLPEEERVRQHLALRLQALASALVVIDPSLLPTSMDDAAIIASIARQEDAIPGRKIRSRLEPPPLLGAQAVEAALKGPHHDAIAASLLLVAALWPHEDIIDRYRLSDCFETVIAPCSSTRAIVDALMAPHHRWPAVHEQLRALVEVGFELPNRWLWRIALHRYLLGDQQSLVDLLALHQRWYPAQSEDSRMMRLLAEILTEDFRTGTRTLPPVRSASNPTWRWVIAEAMRQKGQTEAAERALREIVDADGQFVVAWISLAAARNTLHHEAGVVRVLDVLDEIAPPLPAYEYWRQQLHRRRQP